MVILFKEKCVFLPSQKLKFVILLNFQKFAEKFHANISTFSQYIQPDKQDIYMYMYHACHTAHHATIMSHFIEASLLVSCWDIYHKQDSDMYTVVPSEIIQQNDNHIISRCYHKWYHTPTKLVFTISLLQWPLHTCFKTTPSARKIWS